MVTIIALWLPILVSAVFVFIISSIIHTVLTYHQSDFAKVPREDEVMDALRNFNIPPGDYFMPRADSTKDMKTDEFKEKIGNGPVGIFTIMPNRMPIMGKSLLQWFLYSVLVGIFSAYLTGRTFEAGANYLDVFRYAGTVAFAGYSLALIQNSIWNNKKWSSTFKSLFDGLVYALLTGGTFGWLWP